MIAPRLTDPRAKSEYFIGLFRFSEQKDIVKAALKSRMHTINSAIFSRTEPALSTPALDDMVLNTPLSKSRTMRKISNRMSTGRGGGRFHSSRLRSPFISEDMSLKDDATLPTTYRASSQNDVPSVASTLSINSIITPIRGVLPEDLNSPFSVDTILSEADEMNSNRSHSRESNKHYFNGSNSLELGIAAELDTPVRNSSPNEERDDYRKKNDNGNNSLSSATPLSHVEYANNNFSNPSAQVEIASKAQRVQQQQQHKHRSVVALPTFRRSNSFEERDLRHSDGGIGGFLSSSEKEKSHLQKSNDNNNPNMTATAPEPFQGWLNKYSRRGLFKNWKQRYFVLREGKLFYYGEMASQFVGKSLKVFNNLNLARDMPLFEYILLLNSTIG